MDSTTFLRQPSFWIIISVIIIFSALGHKVFSKIILILKYIFHPENKNIDRKIVIKEVEKAILNLRKIKTGATIIIDNKNSVTPFIVDSEPMDSVINGKIIEAIFNKKSPLHDGAIVIKNGRLSKASVFITKLSENKKIPKTFGTRHRSALSLSEESSALVIVVSEETQKVTFFRSGTWRVAKISVLYTELSKEWGN